MKTWIIFFILIFSASGLAQHEPVAKLIDELESPNCELMSAHLDYFFIQLADHPDSTGFVGIFGEKDNLRKNIVQEGMIKTYLEKRGVEKNRVKIIRSSDSEKITIKFWILPPGSQKPDIPAATWSYKLNHTVKPIMFAWSDFEEDVCPYVDTVKLLAEVLSANPQSRTNVVIRITTNREFFRKRGIVLRDLTHKYGVPTKQIRVFKAVRSARRSNEWGPNEEYWLVP